MVCLGAVIVEPSLVRTFYAQLRPISDEWIPEALGVSGFSGSDVELFGVAQRDTKKNFKHLRKTKHSHDPVDDAKGNAEAFLHVAQPMGLGVSETSVL